MKKFFILSFCILQFFCSAIAQQVEESNKCELNNIFSFEKYSNAIAMPFRKAEINADKETNKVIVVFLHSSSAKGDDNVSQLKGKEICDVVTYLQHSNICAVVVAPQCPKNHSWNEPSSMASSTVKMLIDSVMKAEEISKVYLLGASTGGAGVWRLISDYPNTFAAAMVVAAYPWNVYPAYLATTPLCCVVGAKDKRASKSSVLPTIKQMQKRGGEIKLVVLKDADHYKTREQAFDNVNLNWLFSK